MRLRTWSGILAMLILTALPAPAHEKSALDKDDSSGRLDIAAARESHRALGVATSHQPQSRKVTELHFRVITYGKWRRSLLEGKKNFIAIEFNLDADKRRERCLIIHNGEHELVGRLFRHCYAGRRLITTVSVGRSDRHSVHALLDRKHLLLDHSAYEWRAVTSLRDAAGDQPCSRSSGRPGQYGTCVDTTDWKRHRFR